MNLKEIASPIQNELDQFDKFFKSLMKTDVALLNLVISYITKKKGKRVRPTLVFLSAQIAGTVSQRSYFGAAMVELLHTATLIHDDVVDMAKERRGLASINAEWNNKIAVLVGDFLLSKGLLVSVDNNEYKFLQSTSTAVRRMSEGELLSIDKSKKIDCDEETYFRIIADKTASLMATCCEIGAMSTSDDANIQKKLKDFGEYSGIAFQLQDDLFDYLSQSFTIGKPVGNDIKEKKITLPLIYSFANSSSSESKKIYSMIKKGNLKKDDINLIIDFAKNKGGIEYTRAKAEQYSQLAKDCLVDFPDSQAKTSLMNFADFVINRKS